MSRPKGHPKTGGRTAGTPNKITLAFAKSVAEQLQATGHDPILAIIEVAKQAMLNGDLSLALNANKELLQYVAAKKRTDSLIMPAEDDINETSQAEEFVKGIIEQINNTHSKPKFTAPTETEEPANNADKLATKKEYS